MKNFLEEIWELPRAFLAWMVLHLAIWLDVIPTDNDPDISKELNNELFDKEDDLDSK